MVRFSPLLLASCFLAVACGGSSPDQQGESNPLGGAGEAAKAGSGGDTHTVAGAAGAGNTGGANPVETAGASGAAAGSPAAGGSGDSGGAGSGGSSGSAAGGQGGTGDLGASAPYVCNLILGIQTTSEWFGKFEKIADTDRWELMSQDSAHIEKWADPMSTLWALAKKSACKTNAELPDRIVFSATNYDYATVDEFLPKYLAVLNNIKAKYPSAKRIDLMTYTRGPNNKECVGANRSADSYIKPAQDMAAQQAAAMFPGFVFTAPQWEVAACSDFTLCPHLTNDGNVAISATLATYFDGK